MAFAEILENDAIKTLLTHTLKENRVGHAYIIAGAKGIGKITLAKAFAAAILKTENPDAHPDFTVVTNQLYDSSKKQEVVLVDTIRSMKKDIYIRPYMGEKKVYVIPKADGMRAEAQNSLLKVFEEPPKYCTILLLAENANHFLQTILSRAQLLRMQPVGRETLMGYLTEKKGLPSQKATRIAAMSGGNIGKALSFLEEEAAITLREETLKRILSLSTGTHRDLYDFVRFLKQNKADIGLVMEVLLSWSRDLMHMKLGAGEILNQDKEQELKAFCGQIPRQSATRFGEITIKYQQLIGKNVNYPIAMLCMATEYWEEIHDRDHRS
jgi:DNA polymerase-3 subunit delta'